jgi:CheY-like chemotaxis protein
MNSFIASILLIDDDDDLRTLFAGVLRSAGYTVDTASDGKAGLALYSTGLHELVITDIVMPDMDGLELLDALRQYNPRPRVIAMSGGSKLSVPLYLSTARQLGAQRVLSKPIELHALLQAVAEVLNGAAPDQIIRGPGMEAL